MSGPNCVVVAADASNKSIKAIIIIYYPNFCFSDNQQFKFITFCNLFFDLLKLSLKYKFNYTQIVTEESCEFL